MNNNQRVKELRKEGKLDEALNIAIEELNNNPDNIWSKRSISWVYYEFLKLASENNDYIKFIDFLNKIIQLELNEEKMLMDNVVWPINKMFYQLASQAQIDFNKANELLQKVKLLNIEKPSTNFSILIKSIHKIFKDSSNYISIVDWIGLENLTNQDYIEEEFNGRKIMAIAEQIYISYAKHLDNGTPLDAFGQQKEYNLEKIKQFLPQLEQLINNYPQYVYPSYFKAKLLLRLGEGDIMKSFIPFAKQKRNDYWVWQLIAEIYKNNEDLVFSAYAKALSLKAPDKFLVKIKQNFAELLIRKGKYSEAKCEIENIIFNKEKEGFKIPNKVLEWQSMPWFKQAIACNNNQTLYKQYKTEAEDLLFQDIPKIDAVIEFINTEKNIISFIISEHKRGFFKYSQVKKFECGDIITIQFDGEPQENFYKIFTLKKSSNKNHDFIKKVEGKIKIIPSGVGFIDDVFIEKSLIENQKFKDGQNLNIHAIKSFNKKKNEWGWKILRVLN